MDDMEKVATLVEYSKTFRAVAEADGWGLQIVRLREALAAAEAECAEWRGLVGRNAKMGWIDARTFEEVKSADANDATRARLGLGMIGEAASG